MAQEYKDRVIRQAATVMHAWVAGDGDDTTLAQRELIHLLEADEAEESDLVIGLVNLAGLLLVQLETLGEDPKAFLEDVSDRYSG